MTLPEQFTTRLDSRFAIERELGRGGMSTVYLAFDRKLGRPVALKVLRADIFVDPARFQQEIHVTAKLQHPLIVPLLDADEIDGRAYYVMPFVEGESLRDRMNREGRLSVSDAVRVAREVAGAIGHAHQREIVHRDIKPENILLSAGHAMVADFGIARVSAAMAPQDSTLTQQGLAIGTPAYMSPEQALGDPVDGRTDIFSLGCMVYEMLVGALPFSGVNGYGQLAAKMAGAYTPISRHRDDVPDAFDQLLRRMLARDPDDRPSRALDLVAELEAVVQGTVLTPIPRFVELPSNAVAVLAFQSMSQHADDEHIAEGISEAIMHGLTKAGGFRVIARTSAFAMRGSGLDVRDIAARLKVRRVVEGSVRRSGTRLRVTAKVIDGESALELWSERFDRQVDDVFELEDELAGAVASQLKSMLLEEERHQTPAPQPQKAPPTSNVAAYEAYLRGRRAWGQRTPTSLSQAVDFLRQAIQLDPNFALAHAALAGVHATMGVYGMAASHEVAPMARDAAERALALDANTASALCARASVRAFFDWDWDGAERDFRAALAADPHEPTAHQWYASMVLVPQRRFEEAQSHLERACELDPLSLSVIASRSAACYYARDTRGAVHWAREAIALDAQFPMGHFFLGLALEQAGQLREAENALARAMSLSGSGEVLAALASVQSALGDTDAAVQSWQLLMRSASDAYVSPVLFAQLLARTGDSDGAVSQLRQAMDMRASDLIWAGVRPVFDRLHGHASFQRMLGEIGLPAAS